eukprot:gnl/MRDRNA2_/MRDRNA2_179596_c0_seq1.p2 gnl/MRDRNA2_/MRDRNA2_179596_c0~~gnl/MRDRNA2_/MRDRNA2_179596_c0_seq1.p2  ORF type:complete len:108 (-),score=16.97 gnl/MRDRNA2_/MRDRNA2_179596_c0_seq1:163-486(-)
MLWLKIGAQVSLSEAAKFFHATVLAGLQNALVGSAIVMTGTAAMAPTRCVAVPWCQTVIVPTQAFAPEVESFRALVLTVLVNAAHTCTLAKMANAIQAGGLMMRSPR